MTEHAYCIREFMGERAQNLASSFHGMGDYSENGESYLAT
jgi:hypothetical protein